MNTECRSFCRANSGGGRASTYITTTWVVKMNFPRFFPVEGNAASSFITFPQMRDGTMLLGLL
jgi:hypothetical protein